MTMTTTETGIEETASSTSAASTGKSPSISFRLEQEYIEGLDRIAQMRGTDRTEVLRRLIIDECKRFGVPCRRVVIPRSEFERQLYHKHAQYVLGYFLPYEGLQVDLNLKLTQRRQYELKISQAGQPETPLLAGVAELHDAGGYPSIYWQFPAQAGLPEQSGEISKDCMIFNVNVPGY